ASAHANRIAQIEQMKQFESPSSDNILLHVDLNALPAALQMREPRLPHQADGYHTPRDPYFALVCIQFRARGLSVLLYQCGRCMGPAKFPRIRVVSQRLDLFKFLLALFKLVARLKLQGENPFEVDGV